MLNDQFYEIIAGMIESANKDVNFFFNVLVEAFCNQIRKNDSKGGMDVSNAGGTYHSHPNFFANDYNDHGETSHWAISEYCKCIVKHINMLEHINDKQVPELNFDNGCIEAWVNISNSEGCWNRLHTHEGSAWSGVYYVSSSKNLAETSKVLKCSETYDSRLILKPTPHPKEDNYDLNCAERKRFQYVSNFNSEKSSFWEGGAAKVSGCHYVDIEPVPGDLIVFPSWLHHCVLPSKSQSSSEARISIAFNVNFK